MKREYQFTFTVIAMNISFFTLFTPWSIWYIVNRVYQENPANWTPIVSASLSLFQSISFSMAYLNNCSSFFINFICNSHFRNELFSILKIASNTVSVKTSSVVHTFKTNKSFELKYNSKLNQSQSSC